MQISAKIVLLTFGVAGCALHLPAQQQETRLPPYIAAPDDDFSRPPDIPQHQGEVVYSDGQLKVVADNSSLEQLLNEIGSTIGMKIDGQVGEERVFGEYGPGDPTLVVAELLSGAGRNMLLREDSSHHPRELILTPRSGGPSPPQPHGNEPEPRENQEAQENDQQDAPPQPSYHMNPRTPITPVQPGAPVSSDGFPTPPQPASTNTQQAPNGPKTPQQVYDQLMQMENRNAPK